MREKSILKEKSLLLGIKVDMTCKLLKEKKQSHVYNQFSRSGTAVGALISEAEFAQSRADFINKLHVAVSGNYKCRKSANKNARFFASLISDLKIQHFKERCFQRSFFCFPAGTIYRII